MNQSKSPAYSVGRYLRMLPLILLFLSAVSLYASQRESAEVDLTPASALIPATPLQEQRYSLQQPPPEKQRVETFVVVEEMPEFPGGNRALMKFLSDNIQYPAIAKENGIQGRVICSFIVMDDGSIRDLFGERGVDASLDAEAMRVLRLMPDWKPGMQRGQNVNVRFTIPIVFNLNKKESKVIVDDLSVKESVLSVEAQLLPNYVLQEPPPEKKDEIFEKVENMPEFPGGFEAFLKFVSDNFRLPEDVPKTPDKARIFCSLVVLKDGRISDVKVVRGVDPGVGRIIKKEMQSKPRWEPGKEHGQNVNVRVSVLVIIDMMTATRTVINGRN